MILLTNAFIYVVPFAADRYSVEVIRGRDHIVRRIITGHPPPLPRGGQAGVWERDSLSLSKMPLFYRYRLVFIGQHLLHF